MTDQHPDPAPHAAAEADSRDPSRAANQAREEPVLTTPAHDKTPSTQIGQPDSSADTELADTELADTELADTEIASVGASAETRSEPDQAGVPGRTVTDVTAAPGTSEGMAPVQGVHTPDAGPGGAQFDTDQPPVPGRTTGSR
ncbi:MAG: hypothetical protein ACR2KL_07420 [Nocardioidaceae bacterium]